MDPARDEARRTGVRAQVRDGIRWESLQAVYWQVRFALARRRPSRHYMSALSQRRTGAPQQIGSPVLRKAAFVANFPSTELAICQTIIATSFRAGSIR